MRYLAEVCVIVMSTTLLFFLVYMAGYLGLF